MLFEFIIQIIISLFIIFILHYLFNYLKNTYSTKKTKDLVGFHIQKYQEILNEMQHQPNIKPIEFISDYDKEIINNELFDLVQGLSNEDI